MGRQCARKKELGHFNFHFNTQHQFFFFLDCKGDRELVLKKPCLPLINRFYVIHR